MKTYSDIVGDGGSNVFEQVLDQRRAIAEGLAGVDRLVAVGSGKGGVGKSTLTMALAQSLVARGASVAILDADFNGPTQAHMAGLTGAPWVPDAAGRLAVPRRADGLGVVSVGSLLTAGEELSFSTVSSGDQHTWRATREFAMLAQLLTAVDWGRLDYLLFDLPPGAERTLQYAEFLAAALGAGRAAFLMVTIPSDLARGVVARSLTALAGGGAPAVGYVENMAGYLCRDCGEVKPLFPASATVLDAPCLGRVPFDPELAALCDRGWPERGQGLAAVEAVDALAAALESAVPITSEAPTSDTESPAVETPS
ncbi:MAG TPA: P-loop NTPase [Thermoanaerobaculia bacterium]|nr:P-loop NTPase [Thermoanaerobaculia bacterium]